ncbi:response regulator transcription factor [Pseudomonas gingeri]|nr:MULTISPECIES: response regulator transcription factor [Pseudomonas]NVZ25397.1 response regulator transcription factor [Pseudomonas gingeri]NVZ65896.1 response regulator transcription factor [Pseudomonas gingeri]NVZ76359.1 response regulator transcription factor [Pseudomonas gingeri]NWA06928.1 response regulator transcription factor [Pseudomonas gingeri]NWE49600.1 response regulator transcription factor [Pseudomonas gingeri]
MRVAILDDEPAELRRLEQTLGQMSQAGEPPWTVHSFERGEDLLRRLRRETFDLLILDWQLPDLSGLALLRWTREHMEAPPPAIMLTSRDAENDIVLALGSGADDYVSKPFRANELKARINAVLRRHGVQRNAGGETATFNDLSFDDAELLVSRDGQPIGLTEREYRLARCLFANLGRPLSREYLYERFWPHEEVLSSRPLDTHIYRLRNKLGLTAERGWQLQTVYGYGYRLESVTSETK